MNPEQGWIDVETAGMLERQERMPGPYMVSGSFDLIVNADNVTKLLKWLLGAVTTLQDGAAQRFKHVFTPAQTFKSFSLELCPGVATKSRLIAGTVLRSLAFDAAARELLTVTADVLGAKDKQIGSSAPVFSTLRPFAFFDGSMKLGGSAIADVEAVSCTIARDIPDDVHVQGDRFLPDVTGRGQLITVDGSMDVAFLSWSLYQRFWGAATAVEPEILPEKVALVFESKGDWLGGTGDYSNYRLKINLPKCTLDTSEANFDRRERIVQSLGFTALYDPTSTFGVEVTVTNTKSAP